MAERRMFAKTIIDSDAFLEMPISARLLYYDLAMRADDDGFVNAPKKIMKVIGATNDDMNILILQKFIIPFDSGVVVIKHWRIHNYIRKDTYNETAYKEEKALLEFDENKAYKLSSQLSVDEPRTNRGRTVDTGKVRLGKDSIDKELIVSKDTICPTDVERVIDAWNSLGLDRIIKITEGTQRHTWLRKRIKEYGLEAILSGIEKVRKSAFLNGGNSKGWTITFDWFIRPNNFPKVIGGNYDNDRGSQQDRSGLRKMLENVEKKHMED